MRKGGNIPVQLLDDYLSFIKSLSNEEKLKLEKNEIIIKFDLILNSKGEDFKKNSLFDFNDNLNEDTIIEKLYSFNSRIEGERFLNSTCTNKNAFERVAKKLDLPFQKKDSIEKLVTKIIERTIGFRLRSQAIQGTYEAKNGLGEAPKHS